MVGFEEQNNPDGRIADSNPYGIDTDSTGSVVTDAAANAVLHVDNNGLVSVVAVPPGVPFADRQLEPVPDAVVKGPDGYFYFGELTGAPFPQGLSRVWKVRPGQPATLVSAGFTSIMDLAFDRQGRLLVLEFAERGLASGDPTGRLVRLEANGSQTVLAREGLSHPGGIAVAPNGDIYITNKITGADGQGQLLRLKGAA
jgi:sugar lactone lactonase YvrE